MLMMNGDDEQYDLVVVGTFFAGDEVDFFRIRMMEQQ